MISATAQHEKGPVNMRPVAELSDKTMLEALVTDEGRLGEDEQSRFKDMLGKVGKKGRKLSSRQREYVEKRFTDLELDADIALNLHSNGKVPKGYRPGAEVLSCVPAHLRHPLKPPGRA